MPKLPNQDNKLPTKKIGYRAKKTKQSTKKAGYRAKKTRLSTNKTEPAPKKSPNNLKNKAKPHANKVNSVINIAALLIFIGALGWLAWSVFFQKMPDDFNLPTGDGTLSVTDTSNNNLDNNLNNMPKRQITTTDGVKHSVPLDEIIGGGPPKDGIPSIDRPKFISIKEAEKFLDDDEAGMVVDIDGAKRFYPYQILVWHEIVNDTINGKRVLVTYCPLCFSGIVYDPTVEGEQVEFGTSGKLWQSNLVMYDRKTDSLWSQILGEAIVGERTGDTLKVLPSDLATFGKWKEQNPDGQVLSRDTGAKRFYGRDPYGNYYSSKEIFFPVAKKDDRLDPKEFVFGIVSGETAKAYPLSTLKKVTATKDLEDQVSGKTFVFKFDKKLDAVRVFQKGADGKLTRFNPLNAYWFSWIAAYPDTKLYESK